MTRSVLPLFLCLFFIDPSAQSQELLLEPLTLGSDASLRALSIVNDEVAWASGTRGTVARTLDGGKTWHVHQVKEMEKSDFRTLYAMDKQTAIIANAGSPGKILRTADGGESWSVVYTNNHPEIFFDGADFWNDQEGIVYGDPIDGKMFILKTPDGGKSWDSLETSPHLETGEASFAASGTGIRCLGQDNLIICTGGKVSRLWHSTDNGVSWTFSRPPVVHGTTSAGIFSVAAAHRWIIVGGDFQNDSLAVNHHAYSDDQGKTWQLPKRSTRGYRECIEFLGNGNWVAVGPAGIDASSDDGITWSGVSDVKGLHVVRKARKGKLVLAAGSNGRIYRLK